MPMEIDRVCISAEKGVDHHDLNFHKREKALPDTTRIASLTERRSLTKRAKDGW
jgi:hypothetical protein